MNVADARTRFTLHRMSSLASAVRQQAWERTPDSEMLRRRATEARDRVLADLPGYLDRLEAAARAHGVEVVRVENAQAANRVVIETLRELNATETLRNHHPLLDEIMLDRAAKANAVRLTPLHPGDHLAQLADTRPGHPLWPVGHLSVEEISEALETRWRVPKTYDPDHLASTVRMPLRRTLLRADVAVMGVHFAVADEGVFVLLDNDGHNASLASLARHVILLLSIEHVVADMEDLEALVRVFALSAWGRSLPAYVTHLQRTAPPNIDGPRSLRLVLVDNRRTAIMEEGFGEALRCIHCGACHTVCPVYQQIGGAGYANSPYTGPIGTIVNPILLNPAYGASQAFLCDQAGLCRVVCPVGIDFTQLRQQHRRRLGDATHDRRAFYSLWRRFLSRPRLFRSFWRRATRR
jgi:L-lactate dehydrogenase complex protein LldF